MKISRTKTVGFLIKNLGRKCVLNHPRLFMLALAIYHRLRCTKKGDFGEEKTPTDGYFLGMKRKKVRGN